MLEALMYVKWPKSEDGYKKAFAREKSQNQALRGAIHDTLVFGNCSSFFKVPLWKVLGKKSRSPITRYLDILTPSPPQKSFHLSRDGRLYMTNEHTSGSHSAMDLTVIFHGMRGFTSHSSKGSAQGDRNIQASKQSRR